MNINSIDKGRLGGILGLIVLSFILLGPTARAEELPTEYFQKLVPLHQIKTSPGPYDWLAMHQETLQSYADYAQSNPVRPDAEHPYIYVTLIGDFDAKRQEIIDQTVRFIEAYFGLPVKFTEPISSDAIPAQGRRIHPTTKDRQFHTRYIIEQLLVPNKPADAFSLIAFTATDLYPEPSWNFVFGEADMENRVGVWSIYRNGDPNESEDAYQLCLLRTIKTGTHELGHMFSLPHCLYFECNMNGANHRKESDDRPLWLCPIDLRKLHHNTGMDPLKRYEKLQAMSADLGFKNEAEFYKKSIEALKN